MRNWIPTPRRHKMIHLSRYDTKYPTGSFGSALIRGAQAVQTANPGGDFLFETRLVSHGIQVGNRCMLPAGTSRRTLLMHHVSHDMRPQVEYRVWSKPALFLSQRRIYENSPNSFILRPTKMASPSCCTPPLILKALLLSCTDGVRTTNVP